jgi:hypothetical protein
MTAETKTISRREFLYYLWGASAALFGIGACGAMTWYALPHARANEASGLFTVELDKIPKPGDPPIGIPEGRFWLSNTPQGLLALNIFCVFEVSIYGRACTLIKWVPANDRFECPWCGSKYRKDGTFIERQGPAPRDLDRFAVQVTTASGTRRTPAAGGPADIQGATGIVVDTGNLILGRTHKETPAWFQAGKRIC